MRMFLASRAHFEVVDHGLEGQSLQVFENALFSAEDGSIFLICYKWAKVMTFLFLCLKFRLENAGKPFFFGEHFCVVSLVQDEHTCPWPREGRSLTLDQWRNVTFQTRPAIMMTSSFFMTSLVIK